MSEPASKRGRGRPRLWAERKRLPVYGNGKEMARIKALAAKWKCSGAAAVRRAIEEAAKREGIE